MQSIAHRGPTASTGVADPRKATDKGVVRVTDMVRTDVQSQKLQTFFKTATHGGTGIADAAAVAINSVARKRKGTFHNPEECDPNEGMTAHCSAAQERTAQPVESPNSEALAELVRDISIGRDEGRLEFHSPNPSDVAY